MGTRNQYPVKLVGEASWIGGPQDDVIGSPVKRALLRSGSEIVLGCEVAGYKYDVSLRSTDGIRFEGTFVGKAGYKEYPVKAHATLYSNAEGHFLFGKWYEDNGEYSWWAQLHRVERFSDEAQLS